jgi:hypothetical protein
MVFATLLLESLIRIGIKNRPRIYRIYRMLNKRYNNQQIQQIQQTVNRYSILEIFGALHRDNVQD